VALWVLAGLGNPGQEYARTRHNAGFMVVEAIASDLGADWKLETRFEARVAEARLGGDRLILVEPLTYMNLSGRAVQKVLGYHKVTPERLLVVYDDLAIPLGDVRVRATGSAGGHNGISSMIQCLASQAFGRVRVGIGPLPSGRRMNDFVLGAFTATERDDLERGLDQAARACRTILERGFDAAMQDFNRTVKPANPA
jgi:PTH1 family peptidyl-tRNA hydrolase